MTLDGFPIVVRPLPDNDGGGFTAMAPALPGCMSDGDTVAEALENLADAIRTWLSVDNV